MDMPLVEQRHCPCDGTEIKTVAAIAGDTGRLCDIGNRIIRVGCCPTCGYIGYQDRPTEEWFTHFYDAAWQKREDTDTVIASLKKHGPYLQIHPLARLVARIPFNADAKVFEAGTGYGDALANLKAMGYRHLSGVELCPDRARVAREGFGFDVRNESLEAHQGGPYDLILSFHVLEHCYDPGATIAKLASLQEPGGRLALAIPNAAGEPTMGVLCFLPHLHSFSVRAITKLLERHGYVVESHAWTAESQELIARYTGEPRTYYDSQESHYWGCRDKLVYGLGKWWDHWGAFDTWIHWPMHTDEMGMTSEAGWDVTRTQYTLPRCLHVEKISVRRSNAPVELQWDGPLRLFVK